MRKLFFALAVMLLGAGAAHAQRFQAGVRGGVNFTDHQFGAVRIGGIPFSPGPIRTGYEAGFVLRLNLSGHLHLQSELNYAFVNYGVRAGGTMRRDIRLRAERFEIPVQLGMQFGVFRIFGGALFRISGGERSSAPNLLKVTFNDDDIGITGGLGLNIRKFFVDFRVSGYPRGRVWQTFTSYGTAARVEVRHDIVYGGSIGFFF